MSHTPNRRQLLRTTGACLLGAGLAGRVGAQSGRDVFVHPSADYGRRGAAAAVRNRDGRVRYTYENFEFVAASVPPARVDDLREDRRVRRVERDGEVHLDGHKEGHDRKKEPERGTCEDQPAEAPTWGYERINAEAAHEHATGRGVEVAVIDSGIQSDHCDLAGGVGAGTWCGKGSTSSEDVHGHGTHCAGIVGARKNDVGVVGVAPDVTLRPVRIFGQGSTKEGEVLCGLDWCIEAGVEILSMSFGNKKVSEAVSIGFSVAYDAGHLLVASAGNDGNDEDGDCEEHNVNAAPAGLPGVIAVAAMNDASYDDYPLAFFSSVGPEVELMAPGLQINSTVPVNDYALSSGTSMACPFVSGAAALAWERLGASGPDPATRDVVRRALRESAEDVHGCEDGYGVVRPDRLVASLP